MFGQRIFVYIKEVSGCGWGGIEEVDDVDAMM